MCMSRCSRSSSGRPTALNVSRTLKMFWFTSLIVEITWIKITGINPPLMLEVLAENRLNRDRCIQLLAEIRSGSFFQHRSRTIVPISANVTLPILGVAVDHCSQPAGAIIFPK
jgi:hypothetical protein